MVRVFAFYCNIRAFPDFKNFVCVGKTAVNMKIKEASCDYDKKVKTFKAAIELKRARCFSAV